MYFVVRVGATIALIFFNYRIAIQRNRGFEATALASAVSWKWKAHFLPTSSNDDLARTRAIAQHLADMTDLKVLSIGYTGIETIAGSVLTHLKALTKLTHLGINILHQLEGRQLRNVCDLVELDCLGLGYCRKNSDAGWDIVNRLPILQELDLRETQITDTGLQKLKAMKQLKPLWLNDSKVSDAGVAELQKARPDLKLLR